MAKRQGTYRLTGSVVYRWEKDGKTAKSQGAKRGEPRPEGRAARAGTPRVNARVQFGPTGGRSCLLGLCSDL